MRRRQLGRGLLLVAALALVLLAQSVAANDQEDAAKAVARRAAMLGAARAGLCRVHVYFKRPQDEVEPDYSTLSDYLEVSSYEYESYITHQMSLVATGLLLDREGHVLVVDSHFEDRCIGRVEVVAPDGTRYPTARDRLLERAPGEVLKITEPLKGWEPPAFVAQQTLDPAGKAYVVSLQQDGKRWWLSTCRLGPRYDYEGQGLEPEQLSVSESGGDFGSDYQYLSLMMMEGMGSWWGASTGPGLLCNEEGQPIGAAFPGWPIEPAQENLDWQHERLLAGPALSFEQMAALADRFEEAAGQGIHKCRILYRQESEDDSPVAYMMSRLTSSLSMMDEDQKERTAYGLAIAPRRLLIPQPMAREEAAQLESIEVTVGEQKFPAHFAGAFKDIGAFLVDLDAGELPVVAPPEAVGPHERMRLFFTALAREKFGRKDVHFRPNRWFHEERGYKDRYYPSPVHGVASGAWIVGRDLRILGVYANQRIEQGELHALTSRYGAYCPYDVDEENQRVFWGEELTTLIADPTPYLDPQIRFKTEEEAKRICWIGVEFTQMERELAKQLGVEEQTKDGTIGLYVNRIYARSPAERLGIREGDILLRIETGKLPHPIELNPEQGFFDYFDWDWDWTDFMDYQDMEEYAGTEARWPIRLNYLTMLLKAIGEGETTSLAYLREGEEKIGELEVQLAPPDFSSAKKYKNKELGCTVKDLTYEVRAALRLDEAKQGVIVAKVEPGSPVQVAKISTFELITAVDGAAVASADAFGEMIEQAIAAGKPTVRLTVEYLGKSRLADLDLSLIELEDED